MAKKLTEMSKEELQHALADLQARLEELEEEREFVLGQTGHHLPGHTRRKYEAEIEALKARIREIEDLLKNTSGQSNTA
ncbi:MAG: hypothetical protein PWP65_733 [Clostridia bacterium]|nr:hypothetical protein [Clostridia bacterium]